ncbi:Ig-like domain-containing protein [Reichenbachiella carrageenanivorans]|uniref:Ig-like domain-containing protein n=1 Tax=Reichenbachiella carrageenanivorans TaxID=2979869 RepID=A0ABY6D6X7_9BACT|nr:Ig-like domain-containing protein [Reichenbachiella carrageenanivorans]UXX80833.1 Ig-like domain-containing protein [Reichenbachiella carrageenanivorans]
MKKLSLLCVIWFGLAWLGAAQTYDSHMHFIENNGTTVNLEDVKSDGNGNIYISGNLTANTDDDHEAVDFDPGAGVAQITGVDVSVDRNILFLAKYNAAGQYQWVRWIHEILDQPSLYGGKLAINDDDNVYMTANVKDAAELSTGETVYGPYVYGVPLEGYSGKVIGYTPAGAIDRIIETSFAQNGSQYMEIAAIEADPILGHIFIAGHYRGTPNALPDDTDENAYISYVSTANGQALFTKAVTEGGSNASISALSWSGDGNLIIAGSVSGTPDFDPSASTHTGSAGKFIAKYSSSLAFGWVNSGNSGSFNTSIKYTSGGNPSIVLYNSSTRISQLHEFNISNGTLVGSTQLSDETFSAQDYAYVSNGDIYSVGTIMQSGSAHHRAIVKTLSNGDHAYTTDITTGLSSYFGHLDYDNDIITCYGHTSGFDADLDPVETTILTDGINQVSYDVSESDTPTSIVSYSPAHGATHASGNLSYTVEFNQNLNYVGADGSIYLRQKGTSTGYDVTAADVSTSGSTATIEIKKALSDGSSFLQYELFITNTAFENENGVAYEGNIPTRPTVTVNYTNPTIATQSPIDGATEVALDANVVITFNENIRAGQYAGEGLYDIRIRSSLTSQQQLYFLTDPEVTVGTKSITINPSSDFAPEDELFVNIYYGVIELDQPTDGLYLNPITSSNTWNFTTEAGDQDAPFINGGQYPTEGAPCVSTSNFNAIFNEPIQYGTGQLSLYKIDGSLVSSIDMENDTDQLTIDLSNQRLRFNFEYSVEYGQEYYIQICSTCVEDLAGNPFAGIDDDSWNFNSSTLPVIESTVPAHNATNVELGADIILTPSEYIQSHDGTKTAILKNADGNGVVATVPVSGFVFNMDGTVTIPLPTLSESTTYYLELEANALSSTCGTRVEPITGSSTLSFTTTGPADDTPPVISGFSPAKNATSVSSRPSIQLTMSENVQFTDDPNNDIYIRNKANPSTIYKTIPITSDEVNINENVVIIFPDAELIPNGEVQEVYVGWSTAPFEDLAGNDLDQLFDDEYSFTIDNENPYATAYQYKGDTDVPINISSLKLTFNEPVTARASANIIVRESASSDVITQHYFGTDFSGVSFNGNEVIFTMNQTLDYATEYHVQIVGSSFEDAAGNHFAGLGNLSVYDWYFTTEAEPNEVPTNISLSANTIDENNSIGDVIGTFSTEDADQTSGFTYTFAAGGDDNGSFSIDGFGGLRASASFDYEQKDTYSIRVKTTDSKGASLEKYFEVLINDLDEISPTIESLSPVHEAAGVAIDADLVLTFSEEIKPSIDGGHIRVRPVNGGLNLLGGRPEFETNFFTISNNQLIIHLSEGNSPSNGHQYYVQIDHNAIADIAGNNFAGIADDATTWMLTIEKETQTIDITPVGEKLITDGPFDIQATTTSNLALSYSVLSGPATNNGKTITLTGESGIVIVEISQVGDEYHHATSETISFLVKDASKQDQTITITAIDDKMTTDGAFDIAASSTSGLAVALTVTGPASISGNTITLDGTAGTVTVLANQAGDNNFNPATVASASFEVTEPVVEKSDQTITIAVIEDKLTIDAAFEVEATSTSELEVTLTVTGPATISGNTITLDGTAGTVTVFGNQAGNEEFEAAEAVSISFEVTEPVISSVSNPIYTVKVYPNPANDWIILEGLNAEVAHVQWINMDGTIVMDQQVNERSRIDISNLADGLYLLRTLQDNFITTTKILIH